MRLGCLGLLALCVLGQGLAVAQSPLPQAAPRDIPGSVSNRALMPVVAAPVGQRVVFQAPPSVPPAEALPTMPTEVRPSATTAPTAGTAQISEAERRRQELALHHQGPCETVWVRGGPLAMWISDGPAAPALLTTGGAGLGTIGAADTQILLGTTKFDFETFTGLKLEAGGWLDDQRTWGFEVGGFFLEQKSRSFAVNSDVTGSPLLARPVFDPTTSTEISQLVAFPGQFVGGVTVSATSQLAGGEVNVLRNLAHEETCDFNLLVGFRYLYLDEDLSINSSTTAVGVSPLFFNGSALPAGSSLTVRDRFNAINRFYGGQLGGQFTRWWGPLYLRTVGKVAFGPNHEVQRISGSTTAVTGGSGITATLPGGLLALPTLPTPPNAAPLPFANLGRSSTNWFAIVPEVGVEAGVMITERVGLSAGYNFLYINKVIRPGALINRMVTPSLVPSGPLFGTIPAIVQPQVLTAQEDFIAHGVSLSLEFRY